MSLKHVVLETQRLVLRQMVPSDANLLADLLNDERVMRYYPKRLRPTARAWVDRQLERYRIDGCGFWIVVERASGYAIGQAGLVRQVIGRCAINEIGYYLRSNFWNRGLASEAAAGIRDYAFSERGLSTICSLIRPHNFPSQRVAINVGLRPTSIVSHAGLPHIMFQLKRGC